MKKFLLLCILIPLAFTACNFSALFADKAEMPTDNCDNTMPEVFDKDSPVKYLRASDADYTGKISLIWEPVTKADYYVVERAPVRNPLVKSAEGIEESDWVELGPSSAVSYTDDAAVIKSSASYYAYRVKAFSMAEQAYTPYSDVSFGTVLANVNDIETTKGTAEGKVVLKWRQVPGAAYYYIYKSIDKSDFTNVENGPFVAEVAARAVGEDNVYEYSVSGAEAGKNIYFSIKTANKNKTVEVANYSALRYGYSKVLGAPEAPTVNAGKADSLSEIGLSVAGDSNTVAYKIFRSTPGSDEVEITYDEAAFDASSMSIVDSSGISENKPYIYSVYALNDSDAQSPATTVTGFLLSKPKSVALKPSSRDGVKGYEVELSEPVGADEVAFEYDVEVVTESGGSDGSGTYSAADIPFFPITATSTDDPDYQNEVRKISVKTVNPAAGDLTSTGFAEAAVTGIPSDLASFTASRNKKGSKDNGGVYPVELSWSVSPTGTAAAKYEIKRSGGTGSLDMSVSGSLTSYTDGSVKLGETYTYTVTPCDLFGRKAASSSNSDPAYGAITFEKYKEMFEKHCLKPWIDGNLHPEYVSGDKKKIYDYVKAAGLGSLGSATTVGNFRHEGKEGKMTYSAKAQGIGGHVEFGYENFGECDFMYISGTAKYVMNTDASGTGTVDDETLFNMKGLYPGVVDFSKLALSSQAFVGKYKITQDFDDPSNPVTAEVIP